MRKEYIVASVSPGLQYSHNSAAAMEYSAYKRWDIVTVELGQEYDSCIMRGYRPAIVLSQDFYNRVSPIMIVIPLTKQFKGMDRVYHVFIDKTDCMGYESSGMALVEQLRPVDRRFVNHKIGEITEFYLKKKILTSVKNFLLLEECQ